jgi:glyceraldehyde-3-phosphate dehydrogenase/erythrose-4-phosphate dehydrogenase
VTAEEVNALLKEASESYLQGILGFDEVPKVRGCRLGDGSGRAGSRRAALQ